MDNQFKRDENKNSSLIIREDYVKSVIEKGEFKGPIMSKMSDWEKLKNRYSRISMRAKAISKWWERRYFYK